MPCFIEFHWHRTVNVDCTDRTLFTPLNKVWYTVSRLTRNSRLLSGVMFSKKTLSCKHGGRKTYEIWINCLYAIVKIIASSAPIFTELTIPRLHYFEKFYTVFNLNRPINKERTGRSLFRPVSEVWLPLSLYARLPLTTLGKERLHWISRKSNKQFIRWY
jgi:hypothetical protein